MQHTNPGKPSLLSKHPLVYEYDYGWVDVGRRVKSWRRGRQKKAELGIAKYVARILPKLV